MKSNLVVIDTRSHDGVPGKVTYGLQYLQGNSDAYFTLTGWYCGYNSKHQREEFDGCCHDEILAAHPELKPFERLHLSDSTGVPMHAEGNGWYWLAGALGGLGEQYHGGSGSKSAAECLQVFADHARITLAEAQAVADKVQEIEAADIAEAGTTPEHAVSGKGRKWFSAWIEEQKPRWAAEAKQAIAMLPKGDA